MIALGIMSLVLFVIGFFVMGWLEYIAFALGLCGLIGGIAKKSTASWILGLVGMICSLIGSVMYTSIFF